MPHEHDTIEYKLGELSGKMDSVLERLNSMVKILERHDSEIGGIKTKVAMISAGVGVAATIAMDWVRKTFFNER